MAQYRPYPSNLPCDKTRTPFNIAHGNSDAKCFRVKFAWSLKRVVDNPRLCDNCPYATESKV